MSSDPFTNSNSQHATEAEPDVYSYGQTVVATFQQRRFSTGGASDNGWATSHDGGKTWVHGSLPDLTIYSGGKTWRNKEQQAGPMKLDWLAKTTRGYFAGDYIGTTILPDDDALPVIEVATPPGGGLLHEATYTTPEDALSLSGV